MPENRGIASEITSRAVDTAKEKYGTDPAKVLGMIYAGEGNGINLYPGIRLGYHFKADGMREGADGMETDIMEEYAKDLVRLAEYDRRYPQDTGDKSRDEAAKKEFFMYADTLAEVNEYCAGMTQGQRSELKDLVAGCVERDTLKLLYGNIIRTMQDAVLEPDAHKRFENTKTILRAEDPQKCAEVIKDSITYDACVRLSELTENSLLPEIYGRVMNEGMTADGIRESLQNALKSGLGENEETWTMLRLEYDRVTERTIMILYGAGELYCACMLSAKKDATLEMVQMANYNAVARGLAERLHDYDAHGIIPVGTDGRGRQYIEAFVVNDKGKGDSFPISSTKCKRVKLQDYGIKVADDYQSVTIDGVSMSSREFCDSVEERRAERCGEERGK